MFWFSVMSVGLRTQGLVVSGFCILRDVRAFSCKGLERQDAKCVCLAKHHQTFGVNGWLHVLRMRPIMQHCVLPNHEHSGMCKPRQGLSRLAIAHSRHRG